MKIEFVKRVDVDDSEWYFTQKDGKTYIPCSGSHNKEIAYTFFLKYTTTVGKVPVETILETIEIDAQ